MPQYIRKLKGIRNTGAFLATGKGGKKFTGDTGGTLSWQIGLEDPPYYGLFGSKRKKEESAVADAMGEARRDHPPANTCAEAEAGIRSVRAHIQSTQRSIDDGSTSPRVGPRYLAAYNTILQEYSNFYNNNCLIEPEPSIIQPLDTGMQIDPNKKLVDPILQTALPSVPATPSQVAALQQGSNQQQIGTGTQQSAPGGTVTTGSKVPKWAWYAGGGIAAITIIVLFLKKKAIS